MGLIASVGRAVLATAAVSAASFSLAGSCNGRRVPRAPMTLFWPPARSFSGELDGDVGSNAGAPGGGALTRPEPRPPVFRELEVKDRGNRMPPNMDLTPQPFEFDCSTWPAATESARGGTSKPDDNSGTSAGFPSKDGVGSAGSTSGVSLCWPLLLQLSLLPEREGVCTA